MADAAYVKMREQKQNQSILISGESGSGKTESTVWKFLEYLSYSYVLLEINFEVFSLPSQQN